MLLDRIMAAGFDGGRSGQRAGSCEVRKAGLGLGWTIKAAIDEALSVLVLTAAQYERFSSHGEADFADKLLSAMRYEFGRHIEKK
jgi:6-phosphogluconate dehydrogenase (decarboxylating)